MNKTSKRSKPYWEMTTEELREATKEFDQEFIIDTSRPLTAKERREWEQLRRNTQRDLEFHRVNVSLPPSLLKELDALAKQRRLSRSKLIRMGLQTYVSMHQRKGDSRIDQLQTKR